MHISTPPIPEVENFQIKIYYPAGDRTQDLLNQRQTRYHLSQRGEQYEIVIPRKIIHRPDMLVLLVYVQFIAYSFVPYIGYRGTFR